MHGTRSNKSIPGYITHIKRDTFEFCLEPPIGLDLYGEVSYKAFNIKKCSLKQGQFIEMKISKTKTKIDILAIKIIYYAPFTQKDLNDVNKKVEKLITK